MTDDSRADRRRSPYLVSVVAFAGLVLSAQALAQTDEAAGGPLRLMPLDAMPAPESRPLETAPIAEKTRAPAAIQVEGLSAVDPDSVGTIGPDAGGLGVDMWSGTSRRFIETLLARLPDRIESPTLRDLARRLLLSVARVPLAEEGKRTRKSLLALRVERLQALGLIDEAGALLAAAPAQARDSGARRLAVEQMVIEGNFDDACAEALRDNRSREDRQWQRLTVYCQLRAGQTESATFAANVMAETPGFDDPAFLALVDRLAGAGEATLVALPKPTPVHLAMLRDAKLSVPGDAANADSPTVLRMVAMSDNAAVAVRLRAAEQAARLGALAPERLGQIYADMDFPASDVERAMSIADKDGSARARALLYRAAQAQKVATAKAAVLRKAFESAKSAGLSAMTVRLYRPMLLELPANAALAWFAGDAVRALLASGAVEAARPWLLLIRQRALRDESARRLRDSLWASAVIAREAGTAANEPAAMQAWFSSLQERDAASAAAKAELALALMQGIGVYPPEGFYERIIALPAGRAKASVVPPGVLQTLGQAAARRRRGEAVALLLIGFGRTAPGTAGTQMLGEAVKALVAIGLSNDAQALVLEAAADL